MQGRFVEGNRIMARIDTELHNTPRYSIVDIQKGHTFVSDNDYDDMAYTYFHILENVYNGNDNCYLHLVDNETGRAVSVVTGD